MARVQFPYFDYLLDELAKQNPSVEKSFGRHVHWGYWRDPAAARCSDDDYAAAAEQLTLELFALANLAEGDHLLDAGCGFGGTLAALNERFDKLHLVGLNIDPRQLARAREQVRPLRGNTVAFFAGDACDLPFPDASFDCVSAVECIFHFPSREVFFAEAFRVLKPGGVLLLSDFIPARRFRPMCRVGTARWFRKYNAFGNWDIQYTVADYRDLARRSGLPPAAARNITRHTLPTYDYIEHMWTRNNASRPQRLLFRYFLRLTKLFSRLGLINYFLLSFRKPSA